MIGFNVLLRDEGINPAIVRLVRHQDTRWEGRPTPHDLWKAADGRLELYQQIQRRPVFRDTPILASFVGTPFDETLFIGLYRVHGLGTADPGLIDPITNQDVSGFNFYDLQLAPEMDAYRGRLVVDWGFGYRSWVQLAANQDKRVIEIRNSVSERVFPGFLDFRERLNLLKQVPIAWRTALSSVAGIYLLIHPESGQSYVGSAQGAGGFWGRWEQYIASGHGGNRRMQDIPAADYQVSILEVASSSSSVELLLQMESRWKEKLQSRRFGLNAN